MFGDIGCWRGAAGGPSLSCPCYEKGDADILVPKNPRAAFFPLLLSDSAPLVLGWACCPTTSVFTPLRSRRSARTWRAGSRPRRCPPSASEPGRPWRASLGPGQGTHQLLSDRVTDPDRPAALQAFGFPPCPRFPSQT